MAVTASVTNYLYGSQAVHGEKANVQCFYCTLSLATTDLQSGDTWNLGYLPPNARIMSATLKASDMDTHATPALAIDIGDAADADRIFAASDVGQAGTVSVALATAGRFYKTTAKTLLIGGPSTSAATAAAGTLELSIFYVVEDASTSGS